MSAIFTQFDQSGRSDIEAADELTLQTRDGTIVNTCARGDGSVDDQVKRFATGLNWISLRSVFYLQLSQDFQSSLVVHPIRHAFLGQYIIERLGLDLPPDLRRSTLDFFRERISSVKAESDAIIGQGVNRLQLPFFASWAIGRTGSPRSGYDYVLQHRASPEALTLRRRFREMELLSQEPESTRLRVEMAKLRSTLNDDLTSLSRKFTTTRFTPDLSVSLSVTSLSPSISLSGLAKGVIHKLPTTNRRPTGLFRSIARDFMAFSSMGEIADRFTVSRKVRKGTPFVADRTRIEARRFQNASTYFKKPL